MVCGGDAGFEVFFVEVVAVVDDVGLVAVDEIHGWIAGLWGSSFGCREMGFVLGVWRFLEGDLLLYGY